MVKKRQRKRGANKLRLRIVLVLLAFFFVALLVLLTFEFRIPTAVHNIFHKPGPIVIKGQCYSLADVVIYQINNSADCQKECSDNCWVLKKSYKSSEFVPTPGSCNLCNCYCR